MPTKVVDEDRFDLDAWVTGARPAINQVTVYNRPDLVERVNELQQPDTSKPRTYAGGAKRSADLEAAIVAMERSALTFVIKANDDEDVKAAKAAADKDEIPEKDGDARSVYELAQTVIHVYAGPAREFDFDGPRSTVSVPQLKKMRTAMGEAQYAKLWSAMFAVAHDAPEPTPDFSQPS